MHYCVVSRNSTYLDKHVECGEIVSVHTTLSIAKEKAAKLLLRNIGRNDFIAVESEQPRKKGDIALDLIELYDVAKRENRCLDLMRAILSVELTGKRSPFADDAGYHLQDLGLTIEELREKYEPLVRQEHMNATDLRQAEAQKRSRAYTEQKAIDEIRNEPCFAVPAVRGIQARGEFYLAQIPYPILAKLFVFDEEAVPAELRAQRVLNKKRGEAISDYLLENRDDYVLPALTASVDTRMAFEPMGGVSQLGMLHIPMSATMLINDGQHRRHAIELALRSDPTLQNETAPVQIHFDQGLKKSQQMFADINSKAVKPSSALNALYDQRNPYNGWIQCMLGAMPEIKKRIDFENSTPGPRSYKLWSLIAFKKFVTLLTGVNEKTIGQQEKQRLDAASGLVERFLAECGQHLPNWAQMIESKIAAYDIRETMVIGHAVFLEALGIFGRVALFHGNRLIEFNRYEKVLDPDRANWMVMEKLVNINSAKLDPMWENRCVVLGKMQKTTDGTKSTAAKLLQLTGVPLPEDLASVNERVEVRSVAERSANL
ncbi:DNA sulfur modification protein DndB [Pseudomonas sp. RP23018S]|uniref:DNA sulfur modification protein DndB n=1 Tax=Pseudomonas sp. RP23018S TaxID=3096037 RepID=UPI002ACAEF6A|nr:DNA sulfur modification protein DndB [Pseudomonas sp. RP23018S]MDZ5605295.1 DNA sulfur modification protein DndB [Pseudomonas sp. RP23018S]